jgi:hypothetical protein
VATLKQLGAVDDKDPQTADSPSVRHSIR